MTTAKTFTVSESVAREVLTACGLKGVEGWKVGVLTSKLKGAAKAQTEGEALDDKDLQAVLDDVKGALEDGEEVYVGAAGEAEAAESNGAQKPKKKETAVATATAEKPRQQRASNPKPRETSGEGRDKYGSRLGSDCAKVNAKLSSKPKTEPEIRKEAGVKSSVEYHLDKLVRLGFLKWKEDQGYSLAK